MGERFLLALVVSAVAFGLYAWLAPVAVAVAALLGVVTGFVLVYGGWLIVVIFDD